MPKPYNPNDKYAKRAKNEGYRARSVYKLQQLDSRYHLLQPGLNVLDLAAAPGSWLQWIVEKVGTTGKVVGVDLQPIQSIEGAQTFVTDIIDTIAMDQIIKDTDLSPIDLITSDIAPSTSGMPGRDHALSIELNQAIVEVARKYLRDRGNLVMKVFDGVELVNFRKQLEGDFARILVTKVQASRDRSSELYIVCLNKK